MGMEMKNPAMAQTLDTEDFWRYLFSLQKEKKERKSNKRIDFNCIATRNGHNSCLLLFHTFVLPPAMTKRRPIWLQTETALHTRADSRDSMRATMRKGQAWHHTQLRTPRASFGSCPYDRILYRAIFSGERLTIRGQEVTILRKRDKDRHIRVLIGFSHYDRSYFKLT